MGIFGDIGRGILDFLAPQDFPTCSKCSKCLKMDLKMDDQYPVRIFTCDYNKYKPLKDDDCIAPITTMEGLKKKYKICDNYKPYIDNYGNPIHNPNVINDEDYKYDWDYNSLSERDKLKFID